LSSKLIKSFVAIDDNYLPYKLIKKNQSDYYNFSDIDSFVVPLTDKMYLTSKIVREKVLGLFKIRNPPINIDNESVIRIFLTSRKSYKEKINKNQSINGSLKEIILRLELPRFVWIAEIYNINEYEDKLVSKSIIIDSTAGQYDYEPWLLLHDNQKVIFFDIEQNSFSKMNCEIQPYQNYINNLTCFERSD